MKFIIRLCLSGILLLAGSSFSVAQDWSTAFLQQTATLDIKPGVVAEIQQFREKGRSPSLRYASLLAQELRKIALAHTGSQLEAFQAGVCEEIADVVFLKDGLALQNFPLELGTVEKDFEKGFMRVEVVACFPELSRTASEALELYTSPEFRMSTSSTLKRIDEEPPGGASCVETKGIPAILKATFYCNRVQNFFAEGMAVQHSQVTSNPEPDTYQEVFFKESLKSFVELSGGGLGFHYINYSRSDRIGGLKRSLGKNSVITSQKKALEKLRERLKEDGR